MPTNTTFSGINQQLDFQNTAAIAINDVLVRALTGLPQDIPPASPISFGDLSGKYGVGPINGPVSNSQATYFATNSSINLQFITDIYQANVVWSSNLVSGDAVIFTPSGANANILLTRSTVGNSSSNVGVTATLYYGNTLIGSNSVYLSLQSIVYNSNLTFTSTPGGFSVAANGYSAQTATLSITAQANVPGGVINWNVVPNNVGAVSINGNTVTLTATAPRAGVTNTTSYQVSATVSLNGQPVAGSGGGVTANVSALMYSNDFNFVVPANTAVAANGGPLTVSVPFSASGNAPGSVITWGSSIVSGSNAAVLTVATGNLSANLSLLIANASSFSGANSIVTVTANMYSDATLTTLVSSHSANVKLEGLVYGLTYTVPTNNTTSGFTSQTASTTASATYKAGTFAWSYTNLSGVASITSSAGVPNGTAATLSIVDTVTNKVGSNVSSWSITPTISYGSIVVSGPSTNVSLSATVQPFNLVITGPAANAQYANSGPLNSSSILTVSGSTPPGTNVIWTSTKVSGSNATLATASNNQNSTLTLSIASGTFVFSNSVYTVTANCYDTTSGWSLSSTSQQITLNAGTFGLTITPPAASNTQSGYTAQTASLTVSASVLAGQFAWWAANTSGLSPVFSATGSGGSAPGVYSTGSATWSQTVSGVGTNTVSEQWQVAVYAPGNTTSALYASGAQSFTLTAQQNAYSFSVPAATTNTQILGSAASNLSIITTPSCNIVGYTLNNWSSSNTTSGYSFSSNTTAAVVGFATTVTAGAPVAYYTTTVSGQLLDNQSRLVQNFSYPVTLRSYYPSPSISYSNSSVYGYSAQTASGSYALSIWNGATALSVATTTTGNAPSLVNGVQNTSYWAMSYSLATGATYQDLASNITFQAPSITFYDVTVPWNWIVTASLVANNYNPAVVLTPTNSTVAGWTSAQTAYAVITASCNASVTNNYFRWNTVAVDSGSITSAYIQGAGNNQYVIYNSENAIGTLAGTAHNLDCVLNVNGTDVIHTGASPAVSTTATKYNPALVISGPTSNTQSANFTSTASIVLTASANASIPGISYQVSAAAVSGSASVSYGAGNTSCTLSVTGLHTTASATYNVTFSVLTNGTVIQTATQQVSLSATGVVPNYTLTTPGNVSAAGFNFAQTCSSTVYLNGLTGTGDYAVWNMVNVSGTTPAWFTPGGSNGYITTTQSIGSIGSVTGTIYQLCYVYDPAGNLMRSLQSGNYALTSTVYNPAFIASSANGVVTGWGSITATSTVNLSTNSSLIGQTYSFSWAYSSGNTANVVSINTGNASGYIQNIQNSSATTNSQSVFASTSYYNATVSCILNGQTIAGPVTVPVQCSATSYNIWSTVYSSFSSNTTGYQIKQIQTNYPSSLGTIGWTVSGATPSGDIAGSYTFSYTTSPLQGTLNVSGGSALHHVVWDVSTNLTVTALGGYSLPVSLIASCGKLQ